MTTDNTVSELQDTGTLLDQAQKRQEAATEALAEAALAVEQARVLIVNAPGKASDQALANAKRRSAEAQDVLEQAEVALAVYSNRLFAEEHALDLAAWAAASAEVAAVEVRGRHLQRKVLDTLVRVANELEAADDAARRWMAEAETGTIFARGRTFHPARGTVTPPSTLLGPWGQVQNGLERLLRTLEGR